MLRWTLLINKDLSTYQRSATIRSHVELEQRTNTPDTSAAPKCYTLKSQVGLRRGGMSTSRREREEKCWQKKRSKQEEGTFFAQYAEELREIWRIVVEEILLLCDDDGEELSIFDSAAARFMGWDEFRLESQNVSHKLSADRKLGRESVSGELIVSWQAQMQCDDLALRSRYLIK